MHGLDSLKLYIPVKVFLFFFFFKPDLNKALFVQNVLLVYVNGLSWYGTRLADVSMFFCAMKTITYYMQKSLCNPCHNKHCCKICKLTDFWRGGSKILFYFWPLFRWESFRLWHVIVREMLHHNVVFLPELWFKGLQGPLNIFLYPILPWSSCDWERLV